MKINQKSKTMYKKCKLPNGMIVWHLNQYETKFLYKEIFEEKTYMKYGISLNKKSVVLDIGANIGFFTLFVKEKFPDSTIYAFEPSPDLFNILQLNVAQYGRSVTIFQVGLSDKKRKEVFTYYPKYSIISGFHADSASDEQMLLNGAYNQMRKSRFDDPRGRLKEHMVSLIKDKLSGKKDFKCSLTTISNIIKEHRISHIDLLKMDAEKSEENILKGINDNDWLKIKRIAMECHDISGNVKNMINRLLKSKGFEVIVEEKKQFKESGVFNIWAVRVKF